MVMSLSSAVEQRAVNSKVPGSIPGGTAIQHTNKAYKAKEQYGSQDKSN